MPNPDLFEAQDDDYHTSVLPAALTARVAIKVGVNRYWRPLVGDRSIGQYVYPARTETLVGRIG